MILIAGIMPDGMIELMCARLDYMEYEYLFLDELRFPGDFNVTWSVCRNGVAGYIESPAVRALEEAGGMDGAAVRRRTPLNRFGTEEEVAAGIVYLLDPVRAAYVTGTVREVSGGWMAYGDVEG